MDLDAEIKNGEVKSKGREDLHWKLRSRRFVFSRTARVRCEVFWELESWRLKKELWRLGENEIN